MRLKAIIFDFDGIICESVDLKTEAFKRLFEDYPQHLDAIVRYHVENGGVSRFKKFEKIYRDILKEDLPPEKMKELGEKFTQYSYEGVLKAEYVRGGYEFLDKYYKKLKLFIASGTPQEELASIVDARKIAHFFHGIFGSPRTKREIILGILAAHQFKKDEALFIGDSLTDYHAAKEVGMEFIGRAVEEPLISFVDKNRSISDMADLEILLEKEFLLSSQEVKTR